MRCNMILPETETICKPRLATGKLRLGRFRMGLAHEEAPCSRSSQLP